MMTRQMHEFFPTTFSATTAASAIIVLGKGRGVGYYTGKKIGRQVGYLFFGFFDYGIVYRINFVYKIFI